MKTQKINSAMEKDAIELAIKSIGTRGASLDKDIQHTGVSILAHIQKHKEVSLFVKLYAALPKGARSNALVAWALAFGQVSVNEDKATKKERPFLFKADAITNLVSAQEKPWFDFKKPKDPSDEFSLEASFAKFMAGIHKNMKANKIEPTSELAVALYNAERLVQEQIKQKEAQTLGQALS